MHLQVQNPSFHVDALDMKDYLSSDVHIGTIMSDEGIVVQNILGSDGS
jgi:hypothetical protein